MRTLPWGRAAEAPASELAFFASDCLTVALAGTYIAFTEGGSLTGVAGFVDFSAKGWRDRACDWPGVLSAALGWVGFGLVL